MNDTATDALFDTVDAITEKLTDTPQSPSTIARKAKVTTHAADQALRWMVRNNYATAVGNGHWANYRTRRFGEMA